MQTTLIKLAIVVIVVILTIIYIKYLQNENEKLASRVSILTAINESNALELTRLQYAVAVSDSVIVEWEANRLELEALKRANNAKLQKELQDEDFNSWASMPVPSSINSMFNISNSPD